MRDGLKHYCPESVPLPVCCSHSAAHGLLATLPPVSPTQERPPTSHTWVPSGELLKQVGLCPLGHSLQGRPESINLTILCPGSCSSSWPPIPFPYRDLTRTLHFSKPLCSLGTLSPDRPWFFNCRIHSKSFSQTLESNANQGIVLGICSMLLKNSWWLRNLECSKTIRRSICPIYTEHPLREQSQFCENRLQK